MEKFEYIIAINQNSAITMKRENVDKLGQLKS